MALEEDVVDVVVVTSELEVVLETEEDVVEVTEEVGREDVVVDVDELDDEVELTEVVVVVPVDLVAAKTPAAPMITKITTTITITLRLTARSYDLKFFILQNSSFAVNPRYIRI